MGGKFYMANFSLLIFLSDILRMFGHIKLVLPVPYKDVTVDVHAPSNACNYINFKL